MCSSPARRSGSGKLIISPLMYSEFAQSGEKSHASSNKKLSVVGISKITQPPPTLKLTRSSSRLPEGSQAPKQVRIHSADVTGSLIEEIRRFSSFLSPTTPEIVFPHRQLPPEQDHPI